MALRYVSAAEEDYYNFGQDIPVRPVDDLLELTSILMMASFMQQESAMDTPENRARTIQIDNLGISTFEVQLSGTKLTALEDSGKVSAQQFFHLITEEEAKKQITLLRDIIKQNRAEQKPGACSLM